MVFVCPKCQSPMISIGGTNKIACASCRCIFVVRIELQEIAGPDKYDDMVRQSVGETVDRGVSE